MGGFRIGPDWAWRSFSDPLLLSVFFFLSYDTRYAIRLALKWAVRVVMGELVG
jgi:hypothetical protein